MYPVVGFQSQYLGQHGFAIGRGLVGELVGPSLEKEGRIDEGVIVHADGLFDLGLGFPDVVAGNSYGRITTQHLKLQV